MIVEVSEKIGQLKIEPYKKIVRLKLAFSDGLQSFAARREIMNRTRMTRIARIFTDNRIRVDPRHPCNPCSIVYTAQLNWNAATDALANGWGQIAVPLSVQTTGVLNLSNSTGLDVLYQTEDGKTRLEVRLQEETVCLTQKRMVELFQKNVRTINEHILNIFAEGELVPESVVVNSATTAIDGKTYQDTIHLSKDMLTGRIRINPILTEPQEAGA